MNQRQQEEGESSEGLFEWSYKSKQQFKVFLQISTRTPNCTYSAGLPNTNLPPWPSSVLALMTSPLAVMTVFTTTSPQTQKLSQSKYFQSAQLLQGPEALCLDPSQHALINVGGIRYIFPWSTLEDVPQSRLSCLRFCITLREIAEFCDDYDEVQHEFYFDRDPLAFRVIFNFLAKGKLRLLHEICNVALHGELLYWGIDVQLMEPCCRHRVISSVEEVAKHQLKEEEWHWTRRALRAPRIQGSLFHMLGEVVENPHSGLAGKVYAFLSIIMVVVTVVSLCLSTMSDQREEATGKCSQKCRSMFIVESVCIAWFSFEFLVRFFHSWSKLEFFRSPLNIIDAAAILPYYILLLLELGDESVHNVVAGAGKSSLDKLGLILRVMRALRVLYVIRLARHSVGLQTLGLTIQRSMTDFSLLLLFICVAVALFSPLVYFAESELAPNAARFPQLSFSSIPASYWWSIISVSTVGYGDMVPHSIPGKLVALISILSGILILSFPSTSIFHTFHQTYTELKEEHRRLWKEERGAELAKAKEKIKEKETWPDDWPETDFLPGLDDPPYLFVKDVTELSQNNSRQPLFSPAT